MGVVEHVRNGKLKLTGKRNSNQKIWTEVSVGKT